MGRQRGYRQGDFKRQVPMVSRPSFQLGETTSMNVIRTLGHFTAPWLVALVFIALGGCGGPSVVVLPPGTNPEPVSGTWSADDSRAVADEIMTSLLASGVLREESKHLGRLPVFICGSVRNNTDERIATTIFLNDIEAAVLNSRAATVVAPGAQREEIGKEKWDQRVNADPETIKVMGMALGADVMLIGEVNLIRDAAGGRQSKFYQIDMSLFDIETEVKLWTGQREISKEVTR